jgi:hypothetical protein
MFSASTSLARAAVSCSIGQGLLPQRNVATGQRPVDRRRGTAGVALRCSRRRSALAGRTGACSRLAAHQDSQAVTAPRLRFQVVGARCPPELLQQAGQVLPADLGQRTAGAKLGEQPAASSAAWIVPVSRSAKA